MARGDGEEEVQCFFFRYEEESRLWVTIGNFLAITHNLDYSSDLKTKHTDPPPPHRLRPSSPPPPPLPSLAAASSSACHRALAALPDHTLSCPLPARPGRPAPPSAATASPLSPSPAQVSPPRPLAHHPHCAATLDPPGPCPMHHRRSSSGVGAARMNGRGTSSVGEAEEQAPKGARRRARGGVD